MREPHLCSGHKRAARAAVRSDRLREPIARKADLPPKLVIGANSGKARARAAGVADIGERGQTSQDEQNERVGQVYGEVDWLGHLHLIGHIHRTAELRLRQTVPNEQEYHGTRVRRYSTFKTVRDGQAHPSTRRTHRTHRY